jgi:Tol biopolymer transport system component
MLLTDFSLETGSPRWSPDGRSIAFDSREAGDWNVYRVDAAGGVPRRLTPDASADALPAWSRDGRWIYFMSDRGGSQEVWRMPAGGGPAAQITREGGFDSEESWDGRHLYYTKGYVTGVWRMPLEGGDETAVVDGPLAAWGWALAPGGLYFAPEQRLGGQKLGYSIRYLDFDSGEVVTLLRKEGSFLHQSLTVSPDEKWILHAERPAPRSELMLVEDFR